MKKTSPLSACGEEPSIGVSRWATPRPRAAAWIFCEVSGVTVEQSQVTSPGRAPASTPAPPRQVSSTISSLGSALKSTLACAATSRGAPSTVMPATVPARLAASGETSCACTVHPAAARLRAMGKPIRPSPMKPTSPFAMRFLPEGELNAFESGSRVVANPGASEHLVEGQDMRTTRLVTGLGALVVMAMLALVPARAQTGKAEIQWLGQAATKITTPGGKIIVIDPWLTTNPKTPAQYKNLDALGKVDLILVTHAHGDHLGDAPELAKKHNAPLWAPQGLAASLASLGLVPQELSNRMAQGGSIMPFGPNSVKITMVHAEHNSELVWTNPATGKNEIHFGGEPCGFIIQLENGFKIYHMGDTGLFGDMKMIGEYYKPDLILIPIGGGQFVMNPADAAYATRNFLKPKNALPFP